MIIDWNLLEFIMSYVFKWHKTFFQMYLLELQVAVCISKVS